MRIYGLICICPECRRVALYKAQEDGVFNLAPVVCAADGYSMKIIKLDSLLVDQLLKGSDINASPRTTGA
jgi:hypothetical protein